MDKSTLTQITNLPTHALLTFSSLFTGGILLGVGYELIVFEYTSEEGIKKYHDLWKYTIAIVSGVTLIFSILAIYHSIKSKKYSTGVISFIFGMLPVLILFTYVIHNNALKNNDKYYSFAREFSHIYSGIYLALIIFFIILTIIGTLYLYLSLKKIKK